MSSPRIAIGGTPRSIDIFLFICLRCNEHPNSTPPMNGVPWLTVNNCKHEPKLASSSSSLGSLEDFKKIKKMTSSHHIMFSVFDFQLSTNFLRHQQDLWHPSFYKCNRAFIESESIQYYKFIAHSFIS